LPAPEGPRSRLEVFYNWPSLIGIALVAVNVATAIAVGVADFVFGVEYAGAILLLLGLAALVGAAIAGLGGLLGARRRRRGASSRVDPWTLDLAKPRDRRFAFGGIVCLVLLFGLFASATGQGIRYTESRDFCTNVCHAVMEPEGTAALHSPHANVACVECHVGSSALHVARAKLNGVRQLWGVVSGDYARPIPVPVAGMPPADEMCERCHAREHWVGFTEKHYSYFAGDEESAPHPVRMLMKVGGVRPGSGVGEGIHYHMLLDRKVEYVAADPQKKEMLWVRVVEADGTTRTYRREEGGSDEAIAGKPVQGMSCLDCHNRPAHQFRAPTRLMNELIASGAVDRALPFVKVQGVELLEQEYPDRDTALATIDRKLREFYEGEHGRAAGDPAVAAASAALQRAWALNAFPHMRVSWQTYADHLGHLDSPGCFRCHNDELTDEAGSTLFTNCTDCHVVLTQGENGAAAPVDFEQGVPFYHFTDDDTFESYEDCASCHNGGSDIY
jgi:hypothetical protein